MSDNTQVKTHGKTKGLGRGLGSLLGGSDEGAFSKTTEPSKAVEALTAKMESREPALKEGFVEPTELTQSAPRVPDHARIWQVAIEKLNPNPNQPRQNFEKAPLDELALSIMEKGVIQPILARKSSDGEFEIIAGERRWRAAQLAGLKEVPVILKESQDQEVLELALIENIQRENLNPVEEAEAYDYLIKKYHLTQNELAQKVGKERATVTNILRILQLEPGVRQMVSRGEISLGQAKVLLSLPDASAQSRLAEKARSESLSVRALEKLVARAKLAKDEGSEKRLDARAKAALEVGEELQKLIGSKVNVDYDAGKGKITIHFYSDDELNQIVDTIRDSWRK